VSDEDEDLFEPDKGPEEEYQPDRESESDIDITQNTVVFDNEPSPNISKVNQTVPKEKEVRKITSLPKKNLSNYPSETASSTLMKYILQKKEEENLEEKKESSAMDQFFLSMCSTVKQFSPYNQHLAKTKIFSIVSEIELDSLRQTRQQPLLQPIPQCASNFNLQPSMHDFKIPLGQHQQDYHQSPNHRLYTRQQHSENNQETSNTSSATSFFQNFQAGTDTN